MESHEAGGGDISNRIDLHTESQDYETQSNSKYYILNEFSGRPQEHITTNEHGLYFSYCDNGDTSKMISDTRPVKTEGNANDIYLRKDEAINNALSIPADNAFYKDFTPEPPAPTATPVVTSNTDFYQSDLYYQMPKTDINLQYTELAPAHDYPQVITTIQHHWTPEPIKIKTEVSPATQIVEPVIIETVTYENPPPQQPVVIQETPVKIETKECTTPTKDIVGRAKTWSNDCLTNALEALRKGDVTVTAASKMYGIPPSTLYKIAKKQDIPVGTPVNTTPIAWTPENLERALEAIRSGTPIQRASTEFGIPAGTLYGRCRRVGIEFSRSNPRPWSKETMMKAIEVIRTGQMSIKQATIHYNVPYSSLYGRLKRMKGETNSSQSSLNSSLNNSQEYSSLTVSNNEPFNSPSSQSHSSNSQDMFQYHMAHEKS